MGASAPMEPVHTGRIKIYRASEQHTYPGLQVWLGPVLGHLRLWPPKLVNEGDRRWWFRAKRERVIEKSTMWIAWHLPRRVVMWCYVRVGAHATTGKYAETIVPDLSMLDALKRWDE